MTKFINYRNALIGTLLASATYGTAGFAMERNTRGSRGDAVDSDTSPTSPVVRAQDDKIVAQELQKGEQREYWETQAGSTTPPTGEPDGEPQPADQGGGAAAQDVEPGQWPEEGAPHPVPAAAAQAAAGGAYELPADPEFERFENYSKAFREVDPHQQPTKDSYRAFQNFVVTVGAVEDKCTVDQLVILLRRQQFRQERAAAPAAHLAVAPAPQPLSDAEFAAQLQAQYNAAAAAPAPVGTSQAAAGAGQAKPSASRSRYAFQDDSDGETSAPSTSQEQSAAAAGGGQPQLSMPEKVFREGGRIIGQAYNLKDAVKEGIRKGRRR